jgi:diguanylate cyclase (GGDEF)-like protein
MRTGPQLKTKKIKTPADKPKFHCALMQRDADIEARIIRTMNSYDVVLNYFNDIKELSTLGQRVILDMIILAGNGPGEWMLDILPRVKRDSVLQFIPIVYFNPSFEKNTLITAYQMGVDEIVSDFWDDDLVAAKLEMLVMRSTRDLSVNPTTKLPGPASIEQEIAIRLKNGEDIAVCYGDLDNFKAYNDYHGYVHGDKIILMVSHIIRNTVHDLVENGFVGHIGGDDYVFIIPIDKVDIVCQNVISTFDRMIPFRYSDKDREAGFIMVENRKQVMEKFPIMTISIAVLPNHQNAFTHVGEMSHMIADLKKYTKTLPGSNYMVERRQKY